MIQLPGVNNAGAGGAGMTPGAPARGVDAIAPTPLRLPRTRSSFAQMGGAQPPQPTAAMPTAAQPQTTSTTGGSASAGANGVDTQAMVTPPKPAAGSVPTTGFAASNPVTPVAIGSSPSFSSAQNSVGSVVAPSTSDRLKTVQGMGDQALAGLSSTPDRFKLAQDKFDTFANETDPAYQKALRDAEKYGSANGTAGSGMLRTSFGDLALQRGRDLQNERSNVFNEAAGNTMDDRLKSLAAIMGGEGQINAQDAGQRNEQRAEREYQANRGDTAFSQGVQQTELENELTNSNFSRGLQQAEFGYQNDPALAELTAAGQQGEQAQQGFNDVGQLMQLLAYGRGGNLQNILAMIGGATGGAQ